MSNPRDLECFPDPPNLDCDPSVNVPIALPKLKAVCESDQPIGDGGDVEVTIENRCPDRVALPSAVKPRKLSGWIKALADQLCTLNPLAVRSAKPCQVLTTVADPNGGSMIQPRSILDALNCAPFTQAGEGFVFDGDRVMIAPIARSINKLSELQDGPFEIEPGAYLRGRGPNSWSWQNGVLPPIPNKGSLTLQSTSNGGVQWGPAQAPGIQCKELLSKLVTCPKPQSGLPTSIIAIGPKDGDICNPIAGKYDTCTLIREGLKKCLSPKTGNPREYSAKRTRRAICDRYWHG